jgi:hypothetical protein
VVNPSTEEKLHGKESEESKKEGEEVISSFYVIGRRNFESDA